MPLFEVIFGAWLLVTVFTHLPGRWSRWLRHRDAFEVIPSYRLFVPNPRVSGVRVWVKVIATDECSVPAEWQRLTLWRQRNWTHGFWNPRHRVEKALTRSCFAMCEDLRKDHRFRRPSLPYHVERIADAAHRDLARQTYEGAFLLRIAEVVRLADGRAREIHSVQSGPHA